MGIIVYVFATCMNVFVAMVWACAVFVHISFILAGVESIKGKPLPQFNKWMVRTQGIISLFSCVLLIWLIAKQAYVWALYVTIFMAIDAVIACLVWNQLLDPKSWVARMIRRIRPYGKKKIKVEIVDAPVQQADSIGVPVQEVD